MTDSTEEQIGSKNPFRYREYFYDAETGLYYVSSRYYDPEVDRFISPDNEEVLTAEHQNLAQYNLYAYCWNNPVNMSDENGDWPKWATKVVIGTTAIAVGVAATVLNWWCGITCIDRIIKLATAGAVIGASVGKAAKKHRRILSWLFK